MRRRDERGSWYLLTGLVIGILLGLGYAWWIRPVTYTNTSPASLRADYKDRYRALVASAYLANGDLVRARARLELLEDPDIYRSLAEQAQHTLAEGTQLEEARALGLLAVALGQAPVPLPNAGTGAAAGETLTPPALTRTPDLTFQALAATLVSTATLQIPTETIAPTGTLVPEQPPAATQTAELLPQDTSAATWTLPVPTVTTAPGALLVFQHREVVCEPQLDGPLLQVQAQAAAGQPVPGVEVIVTWPGGEDRFFTGLKPEIGLGYADFQMTPGVSYSVRLGESGEPVTGVTPEQCVASGGQRYWGSALLTFAQP